MKRKPIIAITGASGFLGMQLVDHFTGKGWQVIALVRGAHRDKRTGVKFVEYDLGKPVDAAALRGVDYLVHTAYIKADRRHPDAMALNVQGAERILAASRKHRVKKNVFISSMSAYDEAESTYGLQKLAIEKLFNTPHDVSLRPGLVIGNGGIVKNMADFMKTKHVVPLVQGGKQPLQIIGVQDLAVAIERAITRDLRGTLTVANPHVYTYKQFYQMLARELNIKVLFVRAPYWLIMGGLKLVDLLPLKIDIGADNLRGLKKLRSVDTTTDIKKLGIKPQSLEDCVQDL